MAATAGQPGLLTRPRRRDAGSRPWGPVLPSASVLAARLCAEDEDDRWDAFVASHRYGHLLQSSGWSRFRSGWGQRPCRVAVEDAHGRIVAGAQMLIQDTRAGAVAYVPRGPTCAPADESWPLLREAVRRHSGGSIAVRLEPHWPDSAETRRWLRAAGLRAARPVQPPSTVRIELTRAEAALLATMKQKWRYNVRLAQRHGVEVRLGGAQDLDAFGALLEQTARRDGFATRPAAYYADAWRAFGSDAHLYLAERQGQLLAAIMVFHFGDTATYLYGASADAGREHMPNHLLQWEAMRAARDEGRRWYDLWGIPDAIGRAAVDGRPLAGVDTGRGGLWGVWGFKRGFGGEVWRSVGAWDEVYAPARYRIATGLEQMRHLVRGGE
jgi:peptidoglycan pentaglycine glycine transferase (the first glycine)